MKTLVIGDPHYALNNKEETDLLEQQVEGLLTEVEAVVILGDVLDRWCMPAQCRVNTWLRTLSKRIPTTVLVGNHERRNNTEYLTDVHPYVGMDRKRLRIVSSPVRVHNVLYVPYVPPGRWNEATQHLLDGVTLVFCHQSFVGCTDPKSVDEWTGATKVVSGHIHDRMTLLDGVRTALPDHSERQVLHSGWNVYYPGAPLCNNFGDDAARYVCIVDTDTLEVVEVPLKSITRRTRLITPDYNEEDVTFIEEADKYCRIDITGTHTECNVLRMSTQVQEARKRGAQVKTLPYNDTATHEPTQSFMLVWWSRLTDKLDEEALAYIKRVLG